MDLARRRKKGWVRTVVDKRGRSVECLIITISVLWYAVCPEPEVLLVIVRDPDGKHEDDFFFTTDIDAGGAAGAEQYAGRWSIEDTNKNVKQLLGGETLKTIARELVDTVRRNISINWTVKESVRAKLRVSVKRVLRNYGYPPDQQEKATQTVLEQAELICGEEPITEEPTAEPASIATVLPFRRIEEPGPKDRWKNCVPIYTLKAAAGAFSADQTPEPDGWAEFESRCAFTKEMFVAQVIGKSMEPLIPDGAWCLFTREVAGGRYGRTLLIQSSEWNDLGGGFTIKKYGRPPQDTSDGRSHAGAVLLNPANPDFEPIEIREDESDRCRVVAEFLQVIG